ncbi:MAG TPA: molybdate ABC transporter substrate-binding protein [Rariglobus sp.]|jgi:molybdate transport system substrate-binding protein|nr:molybdate ABC transporter substrate-binding protein [Rariglobus sp.]
MKPRALACLLAGIALVTPSLRAEKLTIAAAANLTYALAALDEAYQKANPGDELTTVIGSSGNLFAQITNGAPIDVFLSADTDYPQKLADAGNADAATLTPFATGRLALWTTRQDLDVTNIAAALANPKVKHIAIANPRTAPYGLAAKQTLAALNLEKVVSDKLVVGENITQTAQFVETGNADLGFIALSLLLAPNHKSKGAYSEVPPELYDPIDQGAVITKLGATNAAAKRYITFLKSRTAQDVLTRFGYGVPAFE